ncbi:MAG TPA: polysaccharide deacetylase family protein, partial [Alphaproteobacteria bacterium]|nr:polysaccharide deacetylase family protein [Alphaproteobacteria bacterium]
MPRKPILLFLCAFWSLLPKSAPAATLSEDLNSVVVYAYFQIGTAEDYASDLSIDAFQAQIDEITTGGYNVLSLKDVLGAQSTGQSLPPKSIVLTFETFDTNFMKDALPLLDKNHLPFVLILSAAKLDDVEKKGVGPSWDDVRPLLKNSLVEIGMTPYLYAPEHIQSAEDLKLSINRAKARFREKLDFEPPYFSYPFGEYSPAYRAIASNFAAALTQTSGVMSSQTDKTLVPRFTMTDGFSDIDRFRMTSLALPFPVIDPTPDRVYWKENPPILEFSVDQRITKGDLSKMDCFASGVSGLTKDIRYTPDETQVAIHIPAPFEDGKGRVNCTIPVLSPDGDPDAVRWRWAGFQF